RRVVFRKNQATEARGGAVYFEAFAGRCNMTLENTVFVGNKSFDRGGAMEAVAEGSGSGDVAILNFNSRNSTVTRNKAGGGSGGWSLQGITQGAASTLTASFRNDILWGNKGATPGA